MANGKLRMDIVTALDNAGIKATEDQINGLEKQITKLNAKSSTDQVEKALGRMPGKLGQIGGALSGIAGKISLVVGAFTTGYEIGTMFFDKVVKGLFGWKDPIEKLTEANKKLRLEQEREVKAWQYKANVITNAYQAEQSQIDKTIAKLNAQAQSYTRLSKAQSELRNAGEDSEVQRLERERFEDVLRLQSMGDYDAADQANKMYDVLKQELETKKQIRNYDEETNRQEAAILKKREQANRLLDKADSLLAEKAKLEQWKEELDAGMSMADIDKNQAQINARIKQIERDLRLTEKEANAVADDLDAYDIDSVTRQANRATLVDRLNLEGDKLALELDKSVSSSGNLLGVEFAKEVVDNFNKASTDSYNELKDIKANTENLADKLDELLQMK